LKHVDECFRKSIESELKLVEDTQLVRLKIYEILELITKNELHTNENPRK
jgi:hypothetical protein